METDRRTTLQSIGVCVFSKESFGLSKLNFTLERGKKYKFICHDKEKYQTLLGMLEGRYKPERGILNRTGIIQSDRLLLGQKIYTRTVSRYLALKRSPAFFFHGQKKHKILYMQNLRASYLQTFPIYRLKGIDRLKFVLLALCFQETGYIILSSLLYQELDSLFIDFLEEIFLHTQTTVIVCEDPSESIKIPFLQEYNNWHEVITIS